MIEHRRFGNLLPHLILLVGVAIVAFPVYLAVIASTHDNTVIANGQMPLYPGSHAFETYWNTIVSGTGKTTRAPVGGMMLNSLIMAIGIAIGKIAISIISAYAIVFFAFPFRMTAFWTIFITLMLPVEVRIFPTYKITSDLHMLGFLCRPDPAADRVGDRDAVVPAVLHDHTEGTGRGLQDGRRRPDPVLLRSLFPCR